MKLLTFYLAELRHKSLWHCFWLIFLLSYAIWMYKLWLTFLIPILVITLLIYTMTTGVRVAVESVSDKTAELLYTLPISRKLFLLIQILSNFTMITLFFVLQFVIMSFHSFGPAGLIDQDKIGIITVWGILFSLFGLLLGILIGVIAGSTSKGHQISIIVVLVSYVIKTVLQMNPNLINLADLIPLTYYQPLQYLLFRSFVKTSTFLLITFPYYPTTLIVFEFVLFFIC